MICILYSRCGNKLEEELSSHYRSLLPSPLLARIRQFRRWQDAQASLSGKVLLQTGLTKYCGLRPGILRDLQYTTYHRPFLPDSGIDFNISHSGEYVICVIATAARVGVDVERIRPVTIGDFASGFSGQELANIQHAADKYARFFSYWTKKEAIVKAEGKGLHIPLSRIRFNKTEDEAEVLSHRWYLNEILLDGKHCSWLALNSRLQDDAIIRECISLEF